MITSTRATGTTSMRSTTMTTNTRSMATSMNMTISMRSMETSTTTTTSTRSTGTTSMTMTISTRSMETSTTMTTSMTTTGQEIFGASIEADNPVLTAQMVTEPQSICYSPQKTIISSAYNAPVTVEQPADKGIPGKLKPDKLMANEEFYEELRESMRQVEASQEESGNFTRYTHHLGRAEFGTLKKRPSTRPSAATSRDPSGDRIGQRSLAISRDTSGDRLAVASKQPFGSKDIIGRSESRMSGASGGLPDLEVDENIAVINERELSG